MGALYLLLRSLYQRHVTQGLAVMSYKHHHRLCALVTYYGVSNASLGQRLGLSIYACSLLWSCVRVVNTNTECAPEPRRGCFYQHSRNTNDG